MGSTYCRAKHKKVDSQRFRTYYIKKNSMASGRRELHDYWRRETYNLSNGINTFKFPYVFCADDTLKLLKIMLLKPEGHDAFLRTMTLHASIVLWREQDGNTMKNIYKSWEFVFEFLKIYSAYFLVAPGKMVILRFMTRRIFPVQITIFIIICAR